MATLYELTTQAQELYNLLTTEQIDDTTFNDTLEAMGADEKIESYCKVIKQLQADSEMFEAEIDRLSTRNKTAKNSVERMKSALLAFMIATGKVKTKAGSFSVSITNSKSVNVTDESKIPVIYLVEQPPKIDKKGIREILKSGEAIPGAELLEKQGVTIRWNSDRLRLLTLKLEYRA